MRASTWLSLLAVLIALFGFAVAADRAESPGQAMTIIDVPFVGHGQVEPVVLATTMTVSRVCEDCGLPLAFLPDGTEVIATLPVVAHDSANLRPEGSSENGLRGRLQHDADPGRPGLPGEHFLTADAIADPEGGRLPDLAPR